MRAVYDIIGKTKLMPRSVEQNEAMRATTRAAILNSAIILFGQNGYAHTSTRSIAQHAGISVGLMYHYFASKEILLRAVFDHCMMLLSTGSALDFQHAPPDKRLSTLIHSLMEILVDDQDFWALFYMLRTQPAITRLLGDDFRLWTRALRDLFEVELRLLGRPNPQLDSYMLYSLLEGTIQQYLLDPNNYPLDAVVDEIVRIYGYVNMKGDNKL